MSNITEIKIGDPVFSMENGKVKEWVFTNFRPNSECYLILTTKDSLQIRQIHHEMLLGDLYCPECFSLTRDQVVDRFKAYAKELIKQIDNKPQNHE
jgi:hypothetical protein